MSVVLPPLAVLLLGLLATGALWRTVAGHERARTEAALVQRASEAGLAVEAEFQRYVDLVVAATALDPASELLTDVEFARYVDNLDMTVSYPGANGLGLAVPVDDANLVGLLERVQAASPRPADAGGGTQGSDDHFVSTMAQRADGKPSLLGNHLTAVPELADALRRARDTGRPAVSRTYTLVTDRDLPPEQRQPGYALVAPVYDTPDVPATVAERRAALRAWIFAGFRGGDFLAETLRELSSDLDVVLVDASAGAAAERTIAAVSDGQPVRAVDAPADRWRTRDLDVFGRGWKLRVAPRPEFLAAEASEAPELTLGAVAVASVLLAALVASLVGGRRRALLAVARTTASLRLAKAELEQSNAELLASNGEARALATFQRDFAASASHELRTPLTSIMGYLELVLDYGDELTQSTRDHLETVRSASRRLLSLVEDLLTVNQIETGNLPLSRTPVRVDDLLGSVRELFEQVCRSCGLRLLVSAEEQLPLLFVDRSRIDQVLANLVSNAIKFTPRGGEVRVRAWQAGDVVNLAVTDTGPGIPDEELSHVFDRFFRSASARSDGVPGTGLGLHIARSMVEGHGGTLTVRSRVGVGTTFVLELPTVAKSKEEPWLVSSSSMTMSPS